MRGTGLQHPPFYSAHFCPTHQKQPPPTTAPRPASPPPRRAVIGRLMGCLCCRCCCCCCGAAAHGARAPNFCPLPVRDVCQRFRACRGQWGEERRGCCVKPPPVKTPHCLQFVCGERRCGANSQNAHTKSRISHTHARAREHIPSSSSSSSSSDNI